MQATKQPVVEGIQRFLLCARAWIFSARTRKLFKDLHETQLSDLLVAARAID